MDKLRNSTLDALRPSHAQRSLEEMMHASKISAVEDNEVRSEEDGTSKQAHVKVRKQTAERLPI